MVVELLRPRDEALAVGRGEKEAAVLLVGEELDRESREPVRLVEPARLSGRDVELEEPVRHVRVVVEIAGSAGAAIAVAAPKPAVVVGERAEQELPQRSSGVDPVGPLEAAPGFGECGERKPVPRRDRLVVTERLRALLSDLEEAGAQVLVELAADDRASVLERLQQLGRHALVLRPCERQPFDAVRVRVLRGCEAAFGEQQLAEQIARSSLLRCAR